MLNNKVTKDLSPEESTMIDQIMSLCSELKSGGQPTDKATTTETVDQPAEDKPTDTTGATKDAKGKKVNKDQITTPSDGATGNSDAEEKIEDPLTEITQESLAEVGKALLNIMKGTKDKVVQKQANPVISALNLLTQEVKKIADRQGVHEDVMVGLLDGMGITQQITKSAETKEQDTRKPVTSDTKNSEVVKMLQDILVKKDDKENLNQEITNKQSNNTKVYKNLTTAGLLETLVGANLK